MIYIASILYLITAVGFYLIQRCFTRTKNGKLRFGLIWLFRVLAFGVTVRGLSMFLPNQVHIYYEGHIAIFSMTLVTMVTWGFYFYIRKKYE